MIRNAGRLVVAAILSWAVPAFAAQSAQAPASQAPAVQAPAAGAEVFRFGAAWYPEQWSEDHWEHDLALMQAAHVNVVRVGEFAWSTMEPSEGRFDFAWLDHAIAAADRHGIRVVLGTPTAAPPAWLTRQYPETLRMDEDLRQDEHGNRRQYSFASARYRVFCRRIAEQMALRYGHDPRVIGWQIDNELSDPSFDPEAFNLWHAWLAAKYGTVAALNRRWTTAYWSQTYDRFDEVPMHPQDENPGLLLDYRRFVTDTWISFVENQVTAIRAHATPAQFVTTNTMHWNEGFDHFRMHEGLDLAAWDEYAPDGMPRWSDLAATHDSVRGYKQKNFWLMETQPAFVNWGAVNRALTPGQMHEWAWQAVGHGADAVLYWQWRSDLNGQEQYHGALVGPDGEPLPAYPVIADIGAQLQRAAPALAGTTPTARVAMLYDYDSRWAIEAQKHNRQYDATAEFDAFYQPLRDQAQAVDVVSPRASLDAYALVEAPELNVLDDDEARRLIAYVEGGGHLVLGPRTGMKDAFDALWPQRQPGPLAATLGARVEQFYALAQPVPVQGEAGAGSAAVWAEALAPVAADARVLLTYGKGDEWLQGKPAVVTRRVGRGSITYVGAWLDGDLQAKLTARLLAEAGVGPVVAGAPQGVEVCERSGPHSRVLILINHADERKAVALPDRMHDLLSGGDTDRVEIAAHAVSVVSDDQGWTGRAR